jgi:FAD/FMN-containing dehydrogenase
LPKVVNWSHTVQCDPQCIAHPSSTEELADIVLDTKTYPGPLRPYGSYHSTSDCARADGGTMVRLDKMRQILEITDELVRVQAGALFIDVSAELQKRGLEFFINLEIGNVTMGSAACCASKDAAFPEGYGQISSYCTAMTMVRADGNVVKIDGSDPQLLRVARSSYGLLGIVTEVSFRIRKIQAISIVHEKSTIDEFIKDLPKFLAGPASISYYLFTFIDRVIVQVRTPTDAPGKPNRWVWKLRNMGVAYFVPIFAYLVSKLPGRWFRNLIAAIFYHGAVLGLNWFIRAKKTIGFDQTTRYKSNPGIGAFGFSLWGFPASEFGLVLKDYVEFEKNHYQATGYRSYMIAIGYHVTRDNNALFSYSEDEAVVTIDPTDNPGPGWERFMDAFNKFCSERGARPLLNQTPKLNKQLLTTAFGGKVSEFESIRQSWDPQNRLLNPYFNQMLNP